MLVLQFYGDCSGLLPACGAKSNCTAFGLATAQRSAATGTLQLRYAALPAAGELSRSATAHVDVVEDTCQTRAEEQSSMQSQLSKKAEKAEPIWFRVLTRWIPMIELAYLLGGLLITYLVYDVFVLESAATYDIIITS